MSTAETLKIPGYQIVQYLGSGARSTIWEVRNSKTGETFALKRVVKHQHSDVRFLDQATNEYTVGSHFNHPRVRRVFRLRRVKKWLSVQELHLFMEFCVGVSLQESRPTDVREVVRIFQEAAEGLAHINTCGYVHADMKPNNIIVAPDGGVKIIDLGQSCPMGTVKKRIQGTPDFIAPEQVGRLPLDARTDVFNFGAAMYWTLSGTAISTAIPKRNVGAFKNDDPPATLEELNPDVPAPLSKMIADCIVANPSRRPDSMNAIIPRLDLIADKMDHPYEEEL